MIYTGSKAPLRVYQTVPFENDIITPIARDLTYALVRIYLNKKEDSRDKILLILNQVMPHMKVIRNNIEQIKNYVKKKEQFEPIPIDLEDCVKPTLRSWRIICNYLYDEISKIINQLSSDILADERISTLVREVVPVSFEDFKEIQEILQNPDKMEENTEKLLCSINKMLNTLEAKTHKMKGG